MPEELRLGASGIWSDSSEIQAPPGAMRDAVNIRIRRPNVIEPRPGLPATSITGPTAPPRHLLQWAGGMLMIAGGECWHVIQGGATTEVTDPDAASLAITYAESCLVKVSDGVMVPTDNGVYYVDEALDAFPAGLPRAEPPAATSVAGTGSGGIAVGEQVALRVLFVDERSSEREIVSAPSVPVTVPNTTGATAELNIRVPIPSGIRAGMELEVYSTDSGVAAGDEMALVASATLSSGDITAGYKDFTSILDTSPIVFGKSLYSNETQQGILQANGEPPRAKRAAWYNQMAFYADIEPKYAQRYTARTYSETHFAASISSDAGVSFGSGVTTINTGISASNWAVGMYVFEAAGTVATAGTYFQANTKVTGVSAGQITIDKATTGVAAGITIYGMDALTIAGNEYIQAGSGRDLSNREFGSWEDLQYLIALDGDVTLTLSDTIDEPSGYPTMVFEGDSSFTLTTAYQAFNGSFGPSGFDGNSAADSRTWPARLMWSKTLEPEHVPAVHFIDVGSHVEPILALETTRDALFVFKRDGVWRVSGFDPENLRVDEFDRTIELISPLATTRHRGDVWAWTTQGILRINDGGAQNMSDNTIRDQVQAMQQETYEQGLAGTVYGGLWLGSSETDGIVVAGLPATGSANRSFTWYVYESRTNAWVRWSGISEDYGAATSCSEDKGQLVFGTGDPASNGCYLCWADYDNRHDLSTATTISTFTANVEAPDGVTYPGSITGSALATKGRRIIDDASGSAWVLFSSGVSEPIVSNTLSTTATNGATARTGFTCTISWVAMVAGNPGQMAHWRNIQMMFADASRLPGVTLGFTSERVPGEATIEVRSYLDPLRPEPIQLRGSVTRSHARAKRLRIRAAIGWADQDWRLEGIALTFQPMRGGERTP